jgi:hypothetical protein
MLATKNETKLYAVHQKDKIFINHNTNTDKHEMQTAVNMLKHT